MEECGESNFQVPQKNENFMVNQFFTLGNIWSRWESRGLLTGNVFIPPGFCVMLGKCLIGRYERTR